MQIAEIDAASEAQPIKILPLDSDRLTLDQKTTALDMVARGRGWLSKFLGDADKRRALFRQRLIDRRILVALYDGRCAGILTFRFRGEGPVAPTLGDFMRTYRLGGLAAWIAFHVTEARLKSAGVYVCSLEVVPIFRGRGIGTTLIAAIQKNALGLDATVMELDVKRSNKKARRLYDRLGFQPALYPRLSLNGFMVGLAPDYQRMAGPISTRPHPPAILGGSSVSSSY